MGRKIKIAIAEDHQLMRQGMAALLNEEDDLEVTFDVGDGAQLLERLEEEIVDIILLDLDMPIINGYQALKVIVEKYPSTYAIIISMFYSDEFVSECITIGARGFLPKNSDIENVIDAIQAVYEQGYYFDDKISKALLNQLLSDKKVEPIFTSEILTKNEIEVLRLICDGLTNKEISDVLCKSVRTIEGYRSSILAKSNSKNTAGLVIYAIKNKLYTIE